jgi:hypothetical protein
VAGPEPLGDNLLKKTTIALVVVVGWWLSAFQSWADKLEHTMGGEIEAFGQPAPWTVTNASVDPINRDWASLDGPPSLDLDRYPQAGADLSTTGIAQTGPMPADRELEGNSDVGASLILIGLGGGVLLSLRWRMSRSAHSDSIHAR